MSHWSEARQMDSASGLWYKFKQDDRGNWHILCSGDRGGLEKKSVIYHDHYRQSNGSWYFQGKKDNIHIIGRDSFIEEIKRQQDRNSLNLSEAEKQELNLTSGVPNRLTKHQVKQLADYRARQAYGNAGYGGDNHGIQVSAYEAEIFDRLVQQYQSTTCNLHWRDANDNKLSASEFSNSKLNWKDSEPEINSFSPKQTQQKPLSLNRKSNRKTTR
jgi:hypothetical protein